MQNASNLNYKIIIPAHNEESHIGKTLDSIVNQSLLPSEVVVVNDNSTDKTVEIIQFFVINHSFIKTINSDSNSTKHEPGTKIIEAFYKGFETINPEWDFIVKLDADVILPNDYFETVAEEFQRNPKAGIVGGIALIEKNEKWIYENIGNKKQVRGPFKAYSKVCFDKIGGLKKSIGWDTADELLARFHGFDVMVLENLEVKLQRPTGQDYQKIHGKKTGTTFYKLDYGWAISFIAATKAAWNKKSVSLLFSISKGYLAAALNNDNKIVTNLERRFIRKYRWRGILNRLVNRT